MAGTNLELAQQGGRYNFEQGQLVTHSDLDRIGDMSVQSLIHFLMLMFYDEDNTTPMSGFPRQSIASDHCLVSGTGDLTYSVAPGFGLAFDSSELNGDEYGIASYRPVVLDTAATGALDAHHATLPRIDIVCIAPAWEDDQAATRNVKNPTTGVLSTSAVDQRRRFSATVSVVAGTPGASPSAPATPAGTIKIAEGEVPATSGATVWRDCRPMIEMGPLFKGAPGVDYVVDHVPEGESNELLVGADSPAAMRVVVQRGRAVVDGVTRYYRRQKVTITTADATNPRIDVVTVGRDGTVTVVAGTPAGTPAAPSPGTNRMGIAEVYVAAGVTVINSGDITDRRRRTPYDGGKVKTASLPGTALVEAFLRPVISVASNVGNICTVNLNLFYPDGTTAYDGDLTDIRFKVELLLAGAGSPVVGYAIGGTPHNASISDGDIMMGAGTDATDILDAYVGGDMSSGGTMYLSLADATATFQIERIDGTVTGDFYVLVTPLGAPMSCPSNLLAFSFA